mmetsp:Transcript_41453/g.125524  ORF Transcript_41453/g.125524 Transcript_41453/m.125524 type:complete len:258 (+) Transcript_41453:1348-2121(+)
MRVWSPPTDDFRSTSRVPTIPSTFTWSPGPTWREEPPGGARPAAAAMSAVAGGSVQIQARMRVDPAASASGRKKPGLPRRRPARSTRRGGRLILLPRTAIRRPLPIGMAATAAAAPSTAAPEAPTATAAPPAPPMMTRSVLPGKEGPIGASSAGRERERERERSRPKTCDWYDAPRNPTRSCASSRESSSTGSSPRRSSAPPFPTSTRRGASCPFPRGGGDGGRRWPASFDPSGGTTRTPGFRGTGRPTSRGGTRRF